MEDFFYAGGLPAVMKEILHLLHGDALTVTGKTIGENVAKAECYPPRSDPHRGRAAASGRRHGGAVRQPGARWRGHQADGRFAATCCSIADRPTCSKTTSRCARRSISDDLPVTKDTVLVMKNCGPKGAPGFPEWGHIPMPKVLLEQGIDDMVRISDARMSGTSFGTVVLHVAPESAMGGPLAVVRTGDEIESRCRRPPDRAVRPGAGDPTAAGEFHNPRRRNTTAAMGACSWSTSRRRTSAAISTFCGRCRRRALHIRLDRSRAGEQHHGKRNRKRRDDEHRLLQPNRFGRLGKDTRPRGLRRAASHPVA